MGASRGNPPFVCCADCGASLRAVRRPFLAFIAPFATAHQGLEVLARLDW